MNFLVGRLLGALVTVYVVATLIFLLLYLVPGDPAEILLSSGGMAPSPEAVEALRRNLGLDQPVLTRYGEYLAGLFRFDLGVSFQDGADIGVEIMRRIPRTLELIGAAGVIAMIVGVPAGLIASLRRGGIVDSVFSAVASFGLSVPVFVTGTIMILFFSQILRLVPAGGYVSFAQNPGQHLVYLLMPSCAIAISLIPVVFRMMRTSVLEVMEREWVRTARAKGLEEGKVLRRHVLRNAITPVISVLALQMGTLLGGTVLVEYVFNWPGLSGMLVQSVEQRDYPAVQAIVLVVCVLFVLINFCIETLYGLLDPRIRGR